MNALTDSTHNTSTAASPAERLRNWRRKSKKQPLSAVATRRLDELTALLTPFGVSPEEVRAGLSKQIYNMSTPPVIFDHILSLSKLMNRYVTNEEEFHPVRKAIRLVLKTPEIANLDPHRVKCLIDDVNSNLGPKGLTGECFIGMIAIRPDLLNSELNTLLHHFNGIDKWRNCRGGATEDLVAGFRTFPALFGYNPEVVIDRYIQGIRFYKAGHCYLGDKIWGSPSSADDLSPFMKYAGRSPQNVVVSYEFIAMREMYLSCPAYNRFYRNRAHPNNILGVSKASMQTDLQEYYGNNFALVLDDTLFRLGVGPESPLPQSKWAIKNFNIPAARPSASAAAALI